MQEIDFNFKFHDIDPAQESTAYAKDTLAAWLAMGSDNDENRIIKFYGWVKSLKEDGKISLDDADKKMLWDFVKSREAANTLKAQVYYTIYKK